MEPQHVGAASGALATMQNLGVAIAGAIFFGALRSGFAYAFEISLIELAALLFGVTTRTRLLAAGRPAR